MIIKETAYIDRNINITKLLRLKITAIYAKGMFMVLKDDQVISCWIANWRQSFVTNQSQLQKQNSLIPTILKPSNNIVQPRLINIYCVHLQDK